MRLAIENRLARKVEQLLEPVVGVGNVRAQISAKIDPQRVITNEERYDPDGQVLRSSQSITESSQSAEGQSDSVSVNTNLPDTSTAGEGATNASRSQRVRKPITSRSRRASATRSKKPARSSSFLSRSRLTTRKRPPVKVKKKRTAPIRFRGRRKKCSNTLE